MFFNLEEYDKSPIRVNRINIVDMDIRKVIFNDPATIVLWKDGTKTVVKCCPDDVFDSEKGLAMAILKKLCGNDGTYRKVFKKWIQEEPNDWKEWKDEGPTITAKLLAAFGNSLLKGDSDASKTI